MTLSMSCQWWLNTLFNKSWNKSLMIGYNLERFANSLANLEHVTLYFDNVVNKRRGIVNDFPWDIFTPLWINTRPSGRVMVSLSWKLCAQRKNKGSMMRRHARMPTLLPNEKTLCTGVYEEALQTKIEHVFWAISNYQYIFWIILLFWSKLVWVTQKLHLNFSTPCGSWVIDQNIQNSVLINTSRTTWPTEIFIPFWISQTICFRWLYHFFKKSVNNFFRDRAQNMLNFGLGAVPP